MLHRVKLIGAVICGAAIISVGAYLCFMLSLSSHLTSALPEPSDKRPYVLVETHKKTYPKAISAFLTDGVYALLHKGTPRNMMLSIAPLAEDTAVLVEELEDGSVEVYLAMRFTGKEMAMLKRGELPDSLKEALKAPTVRAGEEKGVWLLSAEDVQAPVFYKVSGKRVIMAAGEEPFKAMLALTSGRGNSVGRKKWHDEKSWPSHLEICDGGALTASREKSVPLKLEAAWHELDRKKGSDPAGELRWRVIGLDDIYGSKVLGAFKAKTWDTSNCLIPDPLLLSMGVNIPVLDGSPKDWPFPLKTIGELGMKMELSEKQIHEIISGQMIMSFGGQNRILWFSLPGFMIEFTGENKLLKELVAAFWDKLFFGAEPKPVKGFEYGGEATLPFSVMGAGRGNIAVLGLLSPETLKNQNRLGRFLKDDEKVIGWLAADLPRIGAALSDMTRVNSFVEDEEAEDDSTAPLFGNDKPVDDETSADSNEPFQPEMNFSPFDQSITDSFGSVLRRLGNVLIIWEKPDSGRLNWFKAAEKNGAK